MARQTARQREERAHAIDTLREYFPPGSTVTTVLLHVSPSGMSRRIAVLATGRDGNPLDVSRLVATATDSRFSDRGGVIVGGTGMDMGFHLAYGLSRTLYPDGFRCVGRRTRKPTCNANDHYNDYGAARREGEAQGLEGEELRAYVREQTRDGGPRGYRRGRRHGDGGYALTHRWA